MWSTSMVVYRGTMSLANETGIVVSSSRLRWAPARHRQLVNPGGGGLEVHSDILTAGLTRVNPASGRTFSLKGPLVGNSCRFAPRDARASMELERCPTSRWDCTGISLDRTRAGRSVFHISNSFSTEAV